MVRRFFALTLYWYSWACRFVLYLSPWSGTGLASDWCWKYFVRVPGKAEGVVSVEAKGSFSVVLEGDDTGTPCAFYIMPLLGKSVSGNSGTDILDCLCPHRFFYIISDLKKNGGGPMNTHALFDLAMRVVRSLQGMHSMGYLHLDQKPVRNGICISVSLKS